MCESSDRSFAEPHACTEVIYDIHWRMKVIRSMLFTADREV